MHKIFIRFNDPDTCTYVNLFTTTFPRGRYRSMIRLHPSGDHPQTSVIDVDDVDGCIAEEVLQYIRNGLQCGVIDFGTVLIPASAVSVVWMEENLPPMPDDI